MFEYSIIRTKRRTVAIVVTREGQVQVRAPRWAPREAVEDFVRSKTPWIESQLLRIQKRMDARAAFELRPGEKLWYLGAQYPVTAGDRAEPGFDGARFVVPPWPEDELKAGVIGLYRALAERYIVPRAWEIAEKTGLRPARVRISGAATRWGSCSGEGNINFSWRLVTADAAAVDYVIVHELCHLAEHNHSPRFWARVERIMPDYRIRKRLLAQAGKRLSLQDWG